MQLAVVQNGNKMVIAVEASCRLDCALHVSISAIKQYSKTADYVACRGVNEIGTNANIYFIIKPTTLEWPLPVIMIHFMNLRRDEWQFSFMHKNNSLLKQ